MLTAITTDSVFLDLIVTIVSAHYRAVIPNCCTNSPTDLLIIYVYLATNLQLYINPTE